MHNPSTSCKLFAVIRHWTDSPEGMVIATYTTLQEAEQFADLVYIEGSRVSYAIEEFAHVHSHSYRMG